MYLALNDVKKASARRNPRSSSRYTDTITIMANYDPDVFRSMQVDLGSKTPYSDATQVGFFHIHKLNNKKWRQVTFFWLKVNFKKNEFGNKTKEISVGRYKIVIDESKVP